MEKFLYLFTGLLGFIVFFVMVFRLKKNHNTNAYFLIIIFLSNIRFIIYGLIDTFPNLLTLQHEINIVLYLNASPLIYLYFKKLVNGSENFEKRNMLHLITPIFFFIIIWFNNHFRLLTHNEVSSLYIKGLIIIAILYVIASYKLLNNNVWKQNNDLLNINQKNKIFKQWTIILFILFVLMFIRFLIIYVLNSLEINFFNRNQFLWISALICVGLYLKMFQSPELIYGYHMYQKKINEYKENTIVYKNIWITKKPEITNIQDAILKEKMEINIVNYILSIEKIALTSEVFFTENFNTSKLATELNIPKSHILYLFKYHSKIKLSEFTKIIRVQKTIQLTENGYLKTKKMEYLASDVGFTSYSSFFKSFISVTGVSPQEYLKK